MAAKDKCENADHTCNRECLYANATDAWGLRLGGCNYLKVAKCSRVKTVYDLLGVNSLTKQAKEMLLPENCPCFVQAKKPKRRGRPKRKPGTYSFDADKLRQLHGQGLTDKEIGAEMGVSPKTAGTWRRSLGLPTNTPARVSQLDEDRVRKLYEEGNSDDAIGRICGCSHQTIRNWRRREGLPSNYKGGKRRT